VIRALLIVALAGLGLAGCSEREQAHSGTKSDAHVHAGTNKQPPYTAVGWKPGDRTAWEQHMKVRTVQGQNEYAKVP
jgi:hypothetical protein